MMRLLYNLLMPVGFLFFLPNLLWKYRSRGGWKSTYGERFARFGQREKELAAFSGAIWVHAVSVGETIVALSFIRSYLARFPERRFVLSTTTTTGQDIARRKCPPNTAVIFCPIDFPQMVKKTLDLLRPELLVIFETEIWPNLIVMAKKRGIPTALVNARLSDHSAAGYRRLRIFFEPLFRQFDLISAQSDADAGRFRMISPRAVVENQGNLKFDQELPELPANNELKRYLGDLPGQQILLAASTHPGEEKLMVHVYLTLKKEFPALKLVIVPRHAERGSDIAACLRDKKLLFCRKSTTPVPEQSVDVLLADTTGEMLALMKDADIIIMGKSFAGQNEGHNLIEPALLGKPIVTGTELRNFRRILSVLQESDAVVTATDEELVSQLRKLLLDETLRREMGRRAAMTINRNKGAASRTVDALETLLAAGKNAAASCRQR